MYTAAAFWLMKREAVEACVIETGLGGRNDATNALTKPLISVITPLGMDHMHLLGDSLESIASHKFGIIKQGSLALYCGSPAEMNGLFHQACAEHGARGEVFTDCCDLTDVKCSLDGGEFTLRTPAGIKRWYTPLVGSFQPENAALAVRTLGLVADVLPVSEADMRAGLASVKWPGRMEVFRREPDLILDGAHNPHGAAALARSLLSLYGADAQISFVYASMADKNYMGALEQYAHAFPRAKLFCTELAGFARCEKAETLAAKAAVLPWGEPPAVFADPAVALRAALDRGWPVIVCGSLYFIARMRELVKEFEL